MEGGRGNPRRDEYVDALTESYERLPSSRSEVGAKGREPVKEYLHYVLYCCGMAFLFLSSLLFPFPFRKCSTTAFWREGLSRSMESVGANRLNHVCIKLVREKTRYTEES